MAPGQRREVVVGLGQPAYRADQLAGHYFAQLCDPSDAATMTDLPARSRAHLVAALLPRLLTVVREVDCDGGATRKTLWRGFDGTFVESVLMTYPGRVTVCVSSQAGCGMGCPFCATGQVGLTRNLSAAEIVEQVVAAARAVARAEVPGCPARLSNVVFMGMGEPFANYRAVLGAVRRLTDPAPYGLGLAQRSITVSTVGLVPAIDRLADERLRLTLALSLHAPDDELRDTLVPVNTRWPVEEVLGAVRRYAGRTGRRVSIEYAMIDGVNDQPARADLLAERLHRVVGAWLAHVNLIPLNPTPHLNWSASSVNRQQQFVRRLQARGIATTVRGTRGREIAGACGQLMAAG